MEPNHMTDATFERGDPETRRKRLRYRAWHRGTKEADLLIGPFADAKLGGMDHTEMDDFEAVLRLPDPSLVTWLTGQERPPSDVDSSMLRSMIQFHEKS
jgi:antitoxin CptB